MNPNPKTEHGRDLEGSVAYWNDAGIHLEVLAFPYLDQARELCNTDVQSEESKKMQHALAHKIEHIGYVQHFIDLKALPQTSLGLAILAAQSMILYMQNTPPENWRFSAWIEWDKSAGLGGADTYGASDQEE